MHQTLRNTDPAAWVPVIYSRSGYYLPSGIGFGGVIFRERKQTELCPPPHGCAHICVSLERPSKRAPSRPGKSPELVSFMNTK